MIKRYLSFALCCLLLMPINLIIVSAQTSPSRQDSLTAKIKADVAARGVGENKRVEVKKLDGTKLKGYISQADENSFTLVDSKTKQNIAIDYRDVAQVKNRLSKNEKIVFGVVIGAAAAVGIVLGGFLLARCRNEGGC